MECGLIDFSKFVEYKAAEPVIASCVEVLNKFNEKVPPLKLPLEIKIEKCRSGVPLPHGLGYHLEQMATALKSGLPADPRFPDRDNEWIAKRIKENELLVEWLEGFKSKFGEYKEAQETIEQCYAALQASKEVVDKHKVPLMIQVRLSLLAPRRFHLPCWVLQELIGLERQKRQKHWARIWFEESLRKNEWFT